MSIHIHAKKGAIAPRILLPGDPLRAKHIAEAILENSVPFNQVRGMLGYTGNYQGQEISVMGTGMGIPSLSIYVHELMAEYGVKSLIRVGTCGALQPDLKLGDIVLAMSASTDSGINKIRFKGVDFAPTASYQLLHRAYQAALDLGARVFVGPVFSGDSFYNDDPEWWKIWTEFGTLAVDMETAGLYTLAAKFQAEALSILTVGDHLLTGEWASAEAREKEVSLMVKIALESWLASPA